MPFYCYRHGESVIERFFDIGNAPRSVTLGKAIYRRDYAAERVGIPAAKGWPMECVASGVNAAQAGELREHLASKGVPTDVSKDGNPIYRDAAHRRRALKARGLVDRSSFL